MKNKFYYLICIMPIITAIAVNVCFAQNGDNINIYFVESDLSINKYSTLSESSTFLFNPTDALLPYELVDVIDIEVSPNEKYLAFSVQYPHYYGSALYLFDFEINEFSLIYYSYPAPNYYTSKIDFITWNDDSNKLFFLSSKNNNYSYDLISTDLISLSEEEIISLFFPECKNNNILSSYCNLSTMSYQFERLLSPDYNQLGLDTIKLMNSENWIIKNYHTCFYTTDDNCQIDNNPTLGLYDNSKKVISIISDSTKYIGEMYLTENSKFIYFQERTNKDIAYNTFLYQYDVETENKNQLFRSYKDFDLP